MNSNNLELSLIENEIEKISSRYQLRSNTPPLPIPGSQSQPISQLQASQLNYQDKNVINQSQTQKSPSVISFGTNNVNANANMNHIYNGTIKQHFTNDQQINPLQELTLNKKGEVPLPRDQKQKMPKINPKDLTNEELEYIIKTGKMPPRLLLNNQDQVKQQQQQYQQTNIQPLQQQQQQQQALLQQNVHMNNYNLQPLMNSQIDSVGLSKTNNQLSQLQSFLGQNYQDKENNFMMRSVNNYEESVQKSLKNYNSPRIIQDYKQVQINQQQQQVQPINLAQNSFIQLENSSFGKTFDLSQSQQQNINNNNLIQNQLNTSQAASQAIKALQDKIKALESQNSLLEDKLQIVESQSKETIQRLQQKLKEETDKNSAREQHLKEELQIMKRQLETVETEKMRHLEENSAEREQWRQQCKKLEDENVMLKSQLQEHIEKYDGIEETIKDIKRREQQLRDRYEKELEQERVRSQLLDQEVEDAKNRYDIMKTKIREENKELAKENRTVKEEMDRVVSEKERELKVVKREMEKWKREALIVKEEISILSNQEKAKDKDTKNNASNSAIGQPQGVTPKSMNLKSARNYKSPLRDQKQSSQQIVLSQINETQQHSQSIEGKKKSTNSIKSQKKRNSSNVPSVQKETRNQHHSSQKKVREQHLSNERKSSLSASKIKKNSKANRKNQAVSQKPKKLSKENNSQSQSNLISINNTKDGNTVVDYELNSISNQNKDSSQQKNNNNYIFIENNPSSFQSSNQKPNSFNQYKRTSVESAGTIQFGQSSSISDYGALMFSQQFNSVDQQFYDQQQQQLNLQQSKLSNFPRPGLDLNDISKINNNSNNNNSIDNEIFYLEREIFDYNQQYKTLLSQQSSNNNSIINGSDNSQISNQTLNQKLRQVAQLLEEKSERLFELKKQQQQHILRQSYRDQGGFNNKAGSSTGLTMGVSNGFQQQNLVKQNNY